MKTKPSPPEAEPVESAEERTAEDLYNNYFPLGWMRADQSNSESVVKTFALIAMEEYASLRVAQEKAELIKKLEKKINNGTPHFGIYLTDGVKLAINTIKYS